MSVSLSHVGRNSKFSPPHPAPTPVFFICFTAHGFCHALFIILNCGWDSSWFLKVQRLNFLINLSCYQWWTPPTWPKQPWGHFLHGVLQASQEIQKLKADLARVRGWDQWVIQPASNQSGTLRKKYAGGWGFFVCFLVLFVFFFNSSPLPLLVSWEICGQRDFQRLDLHQFHSWSFLGSW